MKFKPIRPSIRRLLILDSSAYWIPQRFIGRGHFLGSALLSILMVFANQVSSATEQADNEAPAAINAEILPEADKLAFAQSLEKAANDGDVAAMNDLIDWDKLIDLITAGPETAVLKEARKGFKTGFLATQQPAVKTGIASQIIETVKQGGSFKFLRLIEVGDEPAALFRLKLPKQGGANYHRYFLKRSNDGLVRAQDIYIFLSAERISETIRRVWLPLTTEVSKNFLEKLLKPVDPLISSIQSVEKMQKLILEGQCERALEIYRKLPENAQKLKIMLLFRLRASMNLSEEEYAASIDAYRKEFPSDAALDFLLIDGYALKKDFENTLECINRTNENLGGDAWLISVRSSVLTQMGRFEEARDAAEQAMKMEPDLEDAYWNAIAVSIMAKNDDDTVRYLTLIEQNIGKQLGDLTEVPFYANFVKTPQYTKWLESRK